MKLPSDDGATTAAPPADFSLLETLLLEHGRYPRLERHIARAVASARYFGFASPEGAMREVLSAHASAHAGSAGARRRVRVVVNRAGVASVESTELDPGGDGPRPVALARTSVSRRDPFLYHKTTHRAVYDARRAERADVFDVLLWNERGEVTEFTIGNVVVELDGARWTPPLDCGLLAGTFRDEILALGEVHERVVRVEELARTTRLWLVNGVRGWVPVVLVAADVPLPDAR